MTKNIPPQEGVRVFDMLDGLSERLEEQGNSTSKKRALITDLTRAVDDTCCNENQANLLKSRINTLAEQTPRTRDEVDLQILPLAAYINSFRMECHGCLNERCLSRDPKFPIDGVKKRARQIAETRERARIAGKK